MVNKPYPSANDEADAALTQQEELHAEAAARAKAFQTWWSGPFGDTYRNLHKKVSKAEAQDAFRAGWTAVVNALDEMGDGYEASLYLPATDE